MKKGEIADVEQYSSFSHGVNILETFLAMELNLLKLNAFPKTIRALIYINYIYRDYQNFYKTKSEADNTNTFMSNKRLR